MIKGHGPGPPAFPLEMLSANHDGHKAQSQQQLLWSKPIFSLRQPCFSPKWVRVSTLQYLNILHSWRFCSLFYLSSKSSGNLLNLVLVLGVKFSKCFYPKKSVILSSLFSVSGTLFYQGCLKVADEDEGQA